jgi:biopolymer transport protein ExbB
VFTIIQAAGWPIWPLLIASVIALALIIERLYSLRRTRVLPAGLLQSVLSTQAHGGYDAARLAALEESSPLGRVLAAGIRNQNSSRYFLNATQDIVPNWLMASPWRCTTPRLVC